MPTSPATTIARRGRATSRPPSSTDFRYALREAVQCLDFALAQGPVENREIVEQPGVVAAETYLRSRDFKRERDVGPRAARKRRRRDGDDVAEKERVGLAAHAFRIPRLEIAEDAQTGMTRLVVSGEVDPERGVVVVLVGELNRVGEPRQIFI